MVVAVIILTCVALVSVTTTAFALYGMYRANQIVADISTRKPQVQYEKLEVYKDGLLKFPNSEGL